MEPSHLQEFYENYSDRVEIVAVNITSKDKPEDAAAFAEEYRFIFPVLLDETGEEHNVQCVRHSDDHFLK